MAALQLNEKQYEAVNHTEGALLILACAGSGKTTVIQERCSNIIHNHLAYPNEILMITFTTKTAQEIRRRIKEKFDRFGNFKTISTFHGFARQILEEDIESMNTALTRDFKILDEYTKTKLIETLLKENNLDNKGKYRDLDSKISKYKVDPINTYLDKNATIIFEKYKEFNQKNNYVDFDDLILYSKEILEVHSDIRQKWHNRLSYIMIDECQDTNLPQYQLIKLLTNKNNNLCLVGDTRQAIHSYAGARIENIQDFITEFSPTKIELNINYRSDKNIIITSNNLVQNTQHSTENLYAVHEAVEPVTIVSNNNEYTEANFITYQIKELVQAGYQYKDIAILYRTRNLPDILQIKLKTANLPFILLDQHKFFEKAEIKDLLAYIGITANPHNNHHLLRVLGITKQGIGKVTIQKIKEIDTTKSIFYNFDNFIASGKNKATSSAAAFKLHLSGIKQYAVQSGRISKILKFIAEKANYFDYIRNTYNKDPDDMKERIKNVFTLFDMADNWEQENYPPEANQKVDIEEKLMDFVVAFSGKSEDVEDNSINAIKMLTIHASKGLEFPVVFLLGFDENILPYSQSILENKKDEERNLLYVAMTRAKRKLYMTTSDQRHGHEYQVSSFLEEFDPHAPLEIIYPPEECYENEDIILEKELAAV